jgi:hypothetical protein
MYGPGNSAGYDAFLLHIIFPLYFSGIAGNILIINGEGRNHISGKQKKGNRSIIGNASFIPL